MKGIIDMKNIGLKWRIIIAIVVFLFFGWISMITGAMEWHNILQTALIGVCAIFLIFDYK